MTVNKFTTPFNDQSTFMKACDQSTDHFNQDQFALYVNLIEEEFEELKESIKDNDRVETLDALIDLIVVVIGAIHSAGFDAEGAWHEVMRTNFEKIDPVTGKVKKREDGKVLKPHGWQPPNLRQFVNKDSQ